MNEANDWKEGDHWNEEIDGNKGNSENEVCFLLLMIVCCFSFVRYYDGDVDGGGGGSCVFFCSLLVHCLWS